MANRVLTRSFSLDKLKVTQNEALRISTGSPLKTSLSYLLLYYPLPLPFLFLFSLYSVGLADSPILKTIDEIKVFRASFQLSLEGSLGSAPRSVLYLVGLPMFVDPVPQQCWSTWISSYSEPSAKPWFDSPTSSRPSASSGHMSPSGVPDLATTRPVPRQVRRRLHPAADLTLPPIPNKTLPPTPTFPPTTPKMPSIVSPRYPPPYFLWLDWLEAPCALYNDRVDPLELPLL